MIPGAGFCEGKIYSFEGNVSELFYDGAGIIAQEGYKVGDPVHAMFYVDFERDGYFLMNNGEVYIPENPPLGNNLYWYFYASLMDGTLLPERNGGLFNGPEDIREYHTGFFNSSPLGNRGVLRGGTANSDFSIYKDSFLDTRVETWVAGEELEGIITASSDTGQSVMWADMKLTRIEGAELPDLFGQWESLTQTCRRAGSDQQCRIGGKLKVRNFGNRDVSSSRMRFYLSDDKVYDEGMDILLKEISTGKIKHGASRVKTLRHGLLGESASGKYVIAVIDADRAVSEATELNNTAVFGPIP
jgi:hypothetical protein